MRVAGYFLGSQAIVEHLRSSRLLHEVSVVQRSGHVTVYSVTDGYLGLPIYVTNSLPGRLSEICQRIQHPVLESFESPLAVNWEKEEKGEASPEDTVHLIRVVGPEGDSPSIRTQCQEYSALLDVLVTLQVIASLTLYCSTLINRDS